MIDIVVATVLLAIPSILVVFLIDVLSRSLPAISTPERERLIAGDSTDWRCRARTLTATLDLPASGPGIGRAAANELPVEARPAASAGAASGIVIEPTALATDPA